jgi:hypothetical protein
MEGRRAEKKSQNAHVSRQGWCIDRSTWSDSVSARAVVAVCKGNRVHIGHGRTCSSCRVR